MSSQTRYSRNNTVKQRQIKHKLREIDNYLKKEKQHVDKIYKMMLEQIVRELIKNMVYSVLQNEIDIFLILQQLIG